MINESARRVDAVQTAMARALAMACGLATLTGCHRTDQAEARAPAPATPTPPQHATADDENAGGIEEPIRVRSAVSVIAVELECPATAVFFAPASADLDAADRHALHALAECLKGMGPGEVVDVNGMAPPTHSEDYDRSLAAQRATNVVSYLSSQGVIGPSFEVRAIREDGATDGMPLLYSAESAAIVIPHAPGDEPMQPSEESAK